VGKASMSRVQGGEAFEIFRPEMQEILIFESFHCWKFSKSNKNQNSRCIRKLLMSVGALN
jgi:hypothetical protein